MNCPTCNKELFDPRSKTCRDHMWLPMRERFLSHVNKTSHCWIWMAAKNKKGYGLFEGLAHRYSYQINKGQIPKGKNVCHNCKPSSDNPSCVNPNHLWIGTQKDNMRDASFKKSWKRRGESHPKSKINFEIAGAIRNLYLDGLTQKAIGRHFNISSQLVSIIVRNEAWVKIPLRDLPLSRPPQ